MSTIEERLLAKFKLFESEDEAIPKLAVDETDLAVSLSYPDHPRETRYSFYSDAHCVAEVPCVFYRDGYCRYGTECKFSHDVTLSGRWMAPCPFYELGFCPQGQICPFLHGEFPCFDFINGECSNAPCRFSHIPLKKDTKKLFRKSLKNDAVQKLSFLHRCFDDYEPEQISLSEQNDLISFSDLLQTFSAKQPAPLPAPPFLTPKLEPELEVKPVIKKSPLLSSPPNSRKNCSNQTIGAEIFGENTTDGTPQKVELQQQNENQNRFGSEHSSGRSGYVDHRNNLPELAFQNSYNRSGNVDQKPYFRHDGQPLIKNCWIENSHLKLSKRRLEDRRNYEIWEILSKIRRSS